MRVFCKRLAVKSSLLHFFVAALKNWGAEAESWRWRLSQTPTFVHLFFQIFFQHKSLFIPLSVSDGGWSSEERKHLLLQKTASRSEGTRKRSQKVELRRYLSPGVPSVGRDENADVGVGELRSDHACTQRRPKARNPNYFKRQNKSARLCENFIPQTKRKMEIGAEQLRRKGWFDFSLWAGNNRNVTGLSGRADGCDEGRTTDWAREREKKIKEVDAHLMRLWFREQSLCWQCFLRCKDSPTRAGAGAGNSGAERHGGDQITPDRNHQDCFSTLFTSKPNYSPGSHCVRVNMLVAGSRDSMGIQVKHFWLCSFHQLIITGFAGKGHFG